MKVTYTRWIVVFVSLFLLHSISMAADAIWPQPMRGVTVNLHLDEAGFKNLSENWKANSVRLMLMSGDIRHPEAPYSIQEHQLKKIDAFLALCKKYNLRCILDVHETPTISPRGTACPRTSTSSGSPSPPRSFGRAVPGMLP